jgi:hypothetical protein
MTAASSKLMISPLPRPLGRLEKVYGIMGLTYGSTIIATLWRELLDARYNHRSIIET